MSFFQVDDNLNSSRKTRALVESALEGRLEGVAAMGLWAMAGADCQRPGNIGDGVVKRVDLIRLLLNAPLVDQLAAMLVEIGFWHAPGHECPRCPPVAEGTFLYHDWFAIGYDTAEQMRVNSSKRKELKDSEVIARVWARDCIDPKAPTIGRCRYCRVELKRADRKSERRWHLDHVDPNKAFGPRNIALSCHTCNQKKGNRTPSEAGMTLLPPPRPEPDENSPSRTAAGTGSPEKSVAGTGSPNVTDAGISPSGSAPTAVQEQAPGDHSPDHFDPPLIGSSDFQPIAGVPARATRAGTGQVRSGWGEGRGLGKDGLAADTPSDSDGEQPRRRARRRGRRSRGQASTPELSTGEVLDAGSAPEVKVPGRFGSPYLGWTGPPATNDEMICTDHGLHEPCRKCAASSGDHAPGDQP